MLDFDKAGGLVPAVAQDAETGEVLMLAWMNREAFEETVRTGRAVYFSRSRNRLWRKGEESGNVQEVRGVYVDCDADTVLLKVKQVGRAVTPRRGTTPRGSTTDGRPGARPDAAHLPARHRRPVRPPVGCLR